MVKQWIFLLTVAFFILSCVNKTSHVDILPEVPQGAQAVSLLGDPLYPATPYENVLEKYEEAKTDYESDPANVENIIWYGRRTAYLGNFREAIQIYSEGIDRFPDDARLYRHRGHRYISIRAFDRAIVDLERAVSLIRGQKDEVEPDGMPNAMNIPVSTLHTNIWYPHLPPRGSTHSTSP